MSMSNFVKAILGKINNLPDEDPEKFPHIIAYLESQQFLKLLKALLIEKGDERPITLENLQDLIQVLKDRCELIDNTYVPFYSKEQLEWESNANIVIKGLAKKIAYAQVVQQIQNNRITMTASLISSDIQEDKILMPVNNPLRDKKIG